MRREPLILPVSALAAGILIGHFFFFNLRDLAVPGTLFVCLVILCLVWRAGHRLRLATICAALLFAGIGTQVLHRNTRKPRLNAADGETVLLSGCIVNPTVFSPDREQFTLQMARETSARITLNLKTDARTVLSYGQRVEVAGKIRSPRNFQNPDSFDYAGYLAAQHIYWTASVASPSDIKVLDGRCGLRAMSWLYAIRTWALDRLTKLYPDDPHTAALLQATLLGETSGVQRRWTSDFRVTGTYHALVISGQHVSVLALTLLLILRLLRFRRVPALGVATLASWLYAIISGFSSPVVRAAGGFTVFLVASYCFRKTRILNVLGLVGLVYLLFDPDELFDPSFQLSFLSAAAIAAFAIPVMEQITEPLRAAVKRFDQAAFDAQVEPKAAQWRVEFRLLAETLRLWTRLPAGASRRLVEKGVLLAAFILDAIIVSACVQFGLALPMIAYFHRLSITGLSANIVIIPLLSLVVPLGFACIFSGWHFLAWIAAILLKAAEVVAAWHAGFEPSWRIAALPVWISIAFAVSLVLLAIAARKGRPLFVAPALACALTIFAILCEQPWKAEIQSGTLEVTAIDVSQGDSLLVVFPRGETMLVDAGGFPGMERMRRKPQIDMGEDVVSPYLWSRRINHLDYAVLTHGHSDHMAGLPAILDNFHPRALWIGAEPDTEQWENVKLHASQDHVRLVAMRRTATALRIGGAEIRVLAPAADYQQGHAPQNDDSLVLEITYGRRSVLLTGDAERPIEDEMVEHAHLRPITLLKVGHHGSRTSSSEEFLDLVQPRFAFISDGYMNQFHHPHPQVLQRLAEHHAAVFRTDQRGLITFRTDGEHVQIDTYR